MKNTSLAIIAALLIASCGKKEEQPAPVETVTETKTVEKTVVTDTVKTEEKDGTSVKVGSDGVDVKSKDVQIEIKK